MLRPALFFLIVLALVLATALVFGFVSSGGWELGAGRAEASAPPPCAEPDSIGFACEIITFEEAELSTSPR